MKVKNDLDVIGDVVFKDYNGNAYVSAVSSGTGGIAEDELIALYFGDIDSVISNGVLTIDMQNDELIWAGQDFRLSSYTGTNNVDNTMDYVLGVNSLGGVKKIEKSTLGSASDSEAFFAYLSTGGGSVGTSESTVGYNTISYNSNSDVFSMSAGVVTVDVAMTACISFTVSVAVPSATRVSVRAELQVSTDGGSNWNEVTGSRAWVYLRQGDNNDDHTIGSSVIIRDTAAGDKYRVTCRTMTGTASIVNYASNITIRDLKGGEAGPTGPAGADGATNTSLVLDGSNILTLTDSDSNTVTADLSSLAGGTTPTLDEVTTQGSNTTNNISVGSVTAQGGFSGQGLNVDGTNGFLFIDESEIGFFVQDIDEANILAITGSGANNDLLTRITGQFMLEDYGSSGTITTVPTQILGTDNSGNVGLLSIDTGKTINETLVMSTSASGTTNCSVGVMYIVDLALTSGGPTFALPGSGANKGDQIWVACNSTTSGHANRLNVSGKLFDTGSSIWSFGGKNDTTANYPMSGKHALKWIWTGTYWYETTNSVSV